MSWNRYKKPRPLYSSPIPAKVRKPKIKWKVLPILWYGLKRTCTLIGAMVLLSMLVSLYITSTVMSQTSVPKLPDEMVLYLDFGDGVTELPGEANFSDPFGFGPPTLRELIDAVEFAKTDKRVHGIVARLDKAELSLAHVQELRRAIKDFRSDEDGKFAYVYASSFGESGNGLGRYYLASAFEEIWMQPLGVISITGINAEIPFFRGALDKIGVTPQFLKRHEYKTAYESMTNANISPENKEMMEALIADIRKTIVSDMADDMGRSPDAIEQLVDRGLFTAREAEQAGLITYADYADVMIDEVNEFLTGDPESEDMPFISISDYVRITTQESLEQKLLHSKVGKHKPQVALVYAVGAIMPDSGTSSAAPMMMDEGIAAADEIATAILDAADDPNIQAVVLRIDSPGGSPVASETILRAVEKAQAEGKPVVVSMGPTAASGGYWIAAYADRIFTLPSTLTGSIGVVGGKFYLKDLWAKIGVNWEGVNWGQNAGLWSMNEPFSESEAARMNAMLDNVYENFTQRVSKGRELPLDYVDKIARGRVWSGKTAVEIGLADEIGGLNEALDYAARTLSLTGRQDISVEIMPRPLTPFEKFLELVSGETMVKVAIADISREIKASIKASLNAELFGAYEPLRLR
jgi:protease-4